MLFLLWHCEKEGTSSSNASLASHTHKTAFFSQASSLYFSLPLNSLSPFSFHFLLLQQIPSLLAPVQCCCCCFLFIICVMFLHRRLVFVALHSRAPYPNLVALIPEQFDHSFRHNILNLMKPKQINKKI